ncbi:MAG: hypothetical protein R3F43_05915 [bacterium]
MPAITARRDWLYAALQAHVPDLRLNGPPLGPTASAATCTSPSPASPASPCSTPRPSWACASRPAAPARAGLPGAFAAAGHRVGEGAFIRLTPGRFTTDAEIDAAAERFAAAVERLRP